MYIISKISTVYDIIKEEKSWKKAGAHFFSEGMPYPEHYFKSGCYGHHSIPVLLDGEHVIKGLYRGAAVPAYPIPIQSSLGKLRSCI